MQDKTIEIRWHGRGGQGSVTSAELLALAAISEGKYAQAMPSFGPERRGAPVLAFNRVHEKRPILNRAGVVNPDIVIVLDPGLLEILDVTTGLKENGYIIVNSSQTIDKIKKHFNCNCRLAVVDASSIAKETLGVNIVNTTMLGALIKTTGLIKIESLEEPIKERFGAKASNNIQASRRAYQDTAITDLKEDKSAKKRGFITEKLPTWREILPGAVVDNPGNAKEYKTGDWRSSTPVFDYEKCNKCGLCFIYCPEGCIKPIENGYFKEDVYYCKGCGICARECPKDAIKMVEVE
jgi:pyruvate ferredoxin oxidoreductase gamma subunit